jgi:hypothetical protein
MPGASTGLFRVLGNRSDVAYNHEVASRWSGAPDFPSKSVGNGSTSLKRKRRAFENQYHIHALRLRFRLVASDFTGIVCILDGD